MMHAIQIIMLYTLNLYSDVCQLHLSKTRKIKIKKKNPGREKKHRCVPEEENVI